MDRGHGGYITQLQMCKGIVQVYQGLLGLFAIHALIVLTIHA